MSTEIPEEIKEILCRYHEDFRLMDHGQVKDVCLSLDGFLSDMKRCDWDWDRWLGNGEAA